MLHIRALPITLVLAQLLCVLSAPIGFQISMFGKVSSECSANEEQLKLDLKAADESMGYVARAFNTVEVQVVQNAIRSALENLSAVSSSLQAGQGANQDDVGLLMSSTAAARNGLDTIFGVPNIETAAELTSASFSLIDAVKNAGAVANTC